MKNFITILLLVVFVGFLSCRDDLEIEVNQVPMKWSYDVPAAKYWESLSIGTGRFAAMISGTTEHEVIALNDETLYTGGPYNSNPANEPETLKKVCKLIFEGNCYDANRELENLAGQPEHSQRIFPSQMKWQSKVKLLNEGGKIEADGERFVVFDADAVTLILTEVALKQLPPHKIGCYGQLQEWFYDFNESEVIHRHIMHLIAFYPDDDITIRKTPKMMFIFLFYPFKMLYNCLYIKDNEENFNCFYFICDGVCFRRMRAGYIAG
jgi:hypothetical protein